jgi:uncharacterized membrane protein
VSQLVPYLLTIHILTAIVAFGPNFALPFIARAAAQEPQHGLFALRLTDRIERRLVLPLALTMPISGGLLAWSESIDPAQAHWLMLAIVLYVVVVAFALVVQLRTIERMIEIASQLAAGGPVLAAGPGAELARASNMTVEGAVASKPGVAAPRFASPGAEMAALSVRARNGGFFLMAMVFVIVSLMAGKPAI